MESVQRELAAVLLGRLRVLGLISDSACSRAMDLVHSDFPDLFRSPLNPAKEADGREYRQDTQ